MTQSCAGLCAVVAFDTVLVAGQVSDFRGFCCARLDAVDRLTQGVSALFLSLRRRPVIRYQAGSELATRLSINLYNLVYNYVSGSLYE